MGVRRKKGKLCGVGAWWCSRYKTHVFSIYIVRLIWNTLQRIPHESTNEALNAKMPAVSGFGRARRRRQRWDWYAPAEMEKKNYMRFETGVRLCSRH